jgi:uncharacterized membrane protein
MNKERLLAFSDGVIAIIITVMVLSLNAPHGVALSALRPLIPAFLCYALSFLFLAIYWNNHHHLFQLVEHIHGRILWANMHLLFWLTLIPFATSWMGENSLAAGPVALYGVNLLCAALAYTILVRLLLAGHGTDSRLAAVIGKDSKGNISVAIYVAAILLAFVSPLSACALYFLVAVMWIIPDRRIEKVLP